MSYLKLNDQALTESLNDHLMHTIIGTFQSAESEQLNRRIECEKMSVSGCVHHAQSRRSAFDIGHKRRGRRSHCAAPVAGCRGDSPYPSDIWSVVILACVNQTSIWETCKDTDGTSRGDTTLRCLHTIDCHCPEFVANLLLGHLAVTILDPNRSRTVSIEFIDNPYHGEHYTDDGELYSMAPKDGTTTCHRHCTAYVVSNEKPLILAMTYVRTDEDEADAVEGVLAHVENYPFEIDLLFTDSGLCNKRVIRRARDIAATVVHVPKKGKRTKDRLNVQKSYMTTYRMYKDSERELRFPLAVAVPYQNGEQGKHGEVVRGYVA